MATLLHIDSSVFSGEASASRLVTDAFRKAWEEQPGATVIYHDLNVNPVPHINAAAHTAAFIDPATHTPQQAAAFAERVRLIEELEQADAVLIGAPMYNYSIPSTLKAWLDNVALMGRTVGENPSAKGIPTTIVASRGGSYAPGTPREGSEYVQNYLQAILGEAFGLELDFIVPELTLAPQNPAMSDLIPLSEASSAKAHADAIAKARQLAGRLTGNAA